MSDSRFGGIVEDTGVEYAIFHTRYPDVVWVGPTRDREQMEEWLEEAKEDFVDSELFVIKERTISDWS